MIEWMVDCGSDLAKEIRVTTDITCLAILSPKVHNALDLLKPLVFVFHRPAHGSGVSYLVVVLVQELRDAVHVPFIDSLKK
jgi:hypothetical protein